MNKATTPEGGKKHRILRKFVSPIVLWNMGGIIVYLLAIFFGVQMWLTDTTNHDETVVVPDVRGMQAEEARRQLADAGLGEPMVDSLYKAQYAGGQVIEQMPRPGHEAKRGRKLRLTVAKNAVTKKKLPDIIGNSSMEVAKKKLQALGFTVTEPIFIPGADGWVYSVRCNGRDITDSNALIAIDKPLTLVVGNGEKDESSDYIIDELVQSQNE